MTEEMHKGQQQGWLLRFIKGMFIGSGFIVPGVSGGALAAIFGIYERMIMFLSNIRKNFKENVAFFIPVGLGALFGIVVLSFGVSYVLEHYDTIVRWFFVGCIIGTAPSLWAEAGKEGRSKADVWMMLAALVFGFVLLFFGQQLFQGQVPANFFTWLISGALIALGMLVPGLSPSNFIMYMGLYQAMSDGFKNLDMSVIIPIGIGGLLTVVLLSKFFAYIFQNYYAKFFHFILGVVFASTLIIVPTNYSGFGPIQYFWCVITLVGGIALGAWMSKLEEKYK